MRFLLLLIIYQIAPCQGCKDTGVNCAQLSHRCSSPIWEEILKRYCPFTCGKCERGDEIVSDSSICIDRAYNCPLLSHRCSDPIYLPIMIRNCAQTCGKCRGADAGKCTDLAYNCPMLIHRCEDDHYGPKMRTYCRNTCGLCSDESSILTNEIFARPEKKEEDSPPLTTIPPVFTLFPYGYTSTRTKEDEIKKLMKGARGIVRLILGWKKRLGKINLF
uniref:ShK domain-containing protein n=1 Tax=Pristionchus pacificus TaxID=54126 RepID=A0A2A6CA47_PRIPA|eukprot:PDM75095.1 ShK domain-containing protein [Pristionchus pacificus]